VVGNELIFQTYFDSSTTIYATDGVNIRSLAEFPDFVIYPGSTSERNIRSLTEFISFHDQLFFIGRTEQGWRLHRIGAIPEPSAIAMAMFAVAPTLCTGRRRGWRA
jgi:hypothetical protein